MYELVEFSSPDALAEAVAAAFLDELARFKVAAATRRHCPDANPVIAEGAFCVALSGGRIAGRLFDALAPGLRARPLSAAPVHFFWSDERCVPPGDPDSNFGLAQARLFGPAGIPAANIHRIHGEDPPPAAAAAAAEAELRRFVPNSVGQPVLDLVLLGMGEDGHVASLFPGEPRELRDNPAVFRVVTSPKPPPSRISIGYGTIPTPGCGTRCPAAP